MGYLTQLAPTEDNVALEAELAQGVNFRQLAKAEGQDWLSNEVYLADTVAPREYIMVKDFHFNLCKSLFPVVDLVLSSLHLRKRLFE